MPRWLVHNWELKLLALLVAAIVWFFVVSADRSQLGFAAPVEYVGLDGSHVVLGTPRETVDVQVEAEPSGVERPAGEAVMRGEFEPPRRRNHDGARRDRRLPRLRRQGSGPSALRT